MLLLFERDTNAKQISAARRAWHLLLPLSLLCYALPYLQPPLGTSNKLVPHRHGAGYWAFQCPKAARGITPPPPFNGPSQDGSLTNLDIIDTGECPELYFNSSAILCAQAN